ncbi:protein CBFA2T2-like [Brevipalpus obovatus]|uniref:protein CBFA2T2-like n=1 Tax=Brevipalpus obovatus TaxID=246614 RepID=UPI003D9EDD0C
MNQRLTVQHIEPGKQGMSTVHHHHHRRVTNSPADGVSSTPPGPSMPVIDSNTSMGNSPSGGQSNENSNVNNCPAPPLIVNGSNSNANLRSSPSSSSSKQYGSSINNSRQISKLKRLLSTLHQFVAETSSEMGDRVQSLIIGLVNSTLSIEEFHQKMKKVTRYPLRPYVIHFLHLNLPLLQAELLRNSRQAKTSLAQYVHQNEGFIFDSSASHSNSNADGEALDIFQPEDNIITRKDFIAKNASALSSTEITKTRDGDRRRNQGPQKIDSGDHLGQLKDEILGDYEPGAFISEFVTCGPKNYAYKVQLPDGNSKTIIKTKGITLNKATLDIINYEYMFDAAKKYADKEDGERLIKVPQFSISSDSHHNLITKYFLKAYRVVSEKRIVSHSITFPYGFKGDRSKYFSPILSGHPHPGPSPVQMPPPSIGSSNQTNRSPMESLYGMPIPFHHIPPRRNVFEDLSCPAPWTAFLQYSANRYAGLLPNGASRPVIPGGTSCFTEQFNERINLADLYEKDQMNYRLVYSLLSGYNSVFNEEFLREMDEEWKNAYTKLNCVLSVIEKTKRTMAILQHRSIELITDSSMLSNFNNSRNQQGRVNIPPPLSSFGMMPNVHEVLERQEQLRKQREHLLSSMQTNEKTNPTDTISSSNSSNSCLSSANEGSKSSDTSKSRTRLVNGDFVYGDPKSSLNQTELLKGPPLSETKVHEDLMGRSKNQRMATESQRRIETISPVNIETMNVFPTPKHATPSIHNCWNCGRKASETCSGCNVARYCSSLCQHEDWENHHRACGTAREVSYPPQITESMKTSTRSESSDMKRIQPNSRTKTRILEMFLIVEVLGLM